MKNKVSILILLMLFISAGSAHSEDVIKDIQDEVKKCELSVNKNFFSDIVYCLEQADVDNISFRERIEYGLAMAMCAKRDLMKIPECINQLSKYVVEIDNSKYKSLTTCFPTRKIDSFKDLASFDDKAPILQCIQPFSNDPEKITKVFTKHDLVKYLLDERDFIVVDNQPFHYSISELEIYFEYMKALYEESD